MRYFPRNSNNSGAVLVFLLVCLTVLLGIAALVIDLGQLYLAKQIAQNTADACVRSGLAKAQALSTLFTEYDEVHQTVPWFTNEANAVADHVNNRNGQYWRVQSPLGGSDPVKTRVFRSGTIIRDDGTPWQIFSSSGFHVAAEVSCCVPVEFTFARIFGAQVGRPSAKATGVLYFDAKMEYPFAPWALHYGTIWGSSIPPDPLDTGEQVPLTVVNPAPDLQVTSNKLFCVDFGDGYQQRLTGPASTLSLAKGSALTLDSVTQDVQAATAQAVDARLNGNPASFEDWKTAGANGSFPDSPRIVVVPLIDSSRRVVGFAPLFIEGFQAGVLTGRFITATLGSGEVRWGLRERTPSPDLSLVARLVIVN